MYARFSEPARIAMQRAEQQARLWKHEYIGTEHILLGLIKEELGVAAHVLKNLDVDPRRLVHEVEKIIQPGDDPITSETLTLTPRAKIAVAYAMEEAGDLHHDYVGTPHLLLGLWRAEEGVASQILMNCDVELEALRQETAKLLVQPE
jgi:ATP-dependent Clp protease ATP-binding subunit ClpC